MEGRGSRLFRQKTIPIQTWRMSDCWLDSLPPQGWVEVTVIVTFLIDFPFDRMIEISRRERWALLYHQWISFWTKDGIERYHCRHHQCIILQFINVLCNNVGLYIGTHDLLPSHLFLFFLRYWPRRDTVIDIIFPSPKFCMNVNSNNWHWWCAHPFIPFGSFEGKM